MNQILYVAPYALVAAALATLVVLVIKYAQHRASSTKETQPVEATPLEWPRCACGALATHPSPKLVRRRTGWLRSVFATAPAYKRVVPRGPYETEQMVFCEIHAHVADSMMERFVFERIRAVQAEANERIAIEAAAFEGEKLVEQIKAITAKRTDSIAPPSPLRLLQTGT